MSELNDILAERESKYGRFSDNATVAQALKRVMEATPNWDKLPDYHKEALHMMASKLSRWLVGDFTYADTPTDIAGYMVRVVKELEAN